MKKLFSCVLAVAMVFTVILAFTSCNSKSEPKTIESYINTEEVQSQMTSLKQAATSMGATMDITGEGNKLIYTYTFNEDTNTEGYSEALKASLDAQASTFENLASSLKTATGVENPVIVVKYLDSKGEELASGEFEAKETK